MWRSNLSDFRYCYGSTCEWNDQFDCFVAHDQPARIKEEENREWIRIKRRKKGQWREPLIVRNSCSQYNGTINHTIARNNFMPHFLSFERRFFPFKFFSLSTIDNKKIERNKTNCACLCIHKNDPFIAVYIFLCRLVCAILDFARATTFQCRKKTATEKKSSKWRRREEEEEKTRSSNRLKETNKQISKQTEREKKVNDDTCYHFSFCLNSCMYMIYRGSLLRRVS